MPIVPCPTCRVSLDISDDTLDRLVRCPKCQKTFRPGDALQAADDPWPVPQPVDHFDAEGDEEAERRRIRRRQRFRGEDDLPSLSRPKGQGLALAARIMLGLAAACQLGLLAISAFALAFVDVREDEALDLFSVNLGVQFLVFVPTAIVFSIWFVRAFANVVHMQVKGLNWSLGWTIGAFFIPIANLFMPYMIAQEIWRASHHDFDPERPRAWKNESGSPLVFLWWLAWVLGLCLTALAIAMDPENNPEPEFLRFALVAEAASQVAFLAAAVLLIFVIGAVVQRQEEKWAEIAANDPEAERDEFDG